MKTKKTLSLKPLNKEKLRKRGDIKAVRAVLPVPPIYRYRG